MTYKKIITGLIFTCLILWNILLTVQTYKQRKDMKELEIFLKEDKILLTEIIDMLDFKINFLFNKLNLK